MKTKEIIQSLKDITNCEYTKEILEEQATEYGITIKYMYDMLIEDFNENGPPTGSPYYLGDGKIPKYKEKENLKIVDNTGKYKHPYKTGDIVHVRAINGLEYYVSIGTEMGNWIKEEDLSRNE